jgi:hypothetical protein
VASTLSSRLASPTVLRTTLRSYYVSIGTYDSTELEALELQSMLQLSNLDSKGCTADDIFKGIVWLDRMLLNGGLLTTSEYQQHLVFIQTFVSNVLSILPTALAVALEEVHDGTPVVIQVVVLPSCAHYQPKYLSE